MHSKTVNLIAYRPEYEYCVPLTTQKEPRTLLLLKTAYVLGTPYFNVSRITALPTVLHGLTLTLPLHCGCRLMISADNRRPTYIRCQVAKKIIK